MEPSFFLADNAVVVSGAVDHRNRPAVRALTGSWRASFFIIGAEVGERFAFFGLSSNLISYLSGPLHQPTAAAAAALNAWSGISYILPLACSPVADRCLGRHRTIICSYFLYLAALAMLVAITASSLSSLQLPSLYAALYAVAVAQGAHKACLQAFGGDQFDPDDPAEADSRSSFFNWYSFSFTAGITAAMLAVSYLEDTAGWVVGFAALWLAVAGSFLVYLLGTKSYRYYKPGPAGAGAGAGGGMGVLRLLPIWASCMMYAVCGAQFSTTFTKGAATLDRRIGNFQMPAAAMQSIPTVTIVAFLPLYDRVFVPIARTFSGRRSGITTLQRVGVGLALGALSMALAALVEMRRLAAARDSGLVDSPESPLPMSLWWLLPHYAIFGVSEAFQFTGLQEFFYSEAPDTLRSLGIAVGLSVTGAGHLLSSLLVWAIDRVTAAMLEGSWFGSGGNLNRAHLDYFYWLLAALSAGHLLLFVVLSKRFAYTSIPPVKSFS